MYRYVCIALFFCSTLIFLYLNFKKVLFASAIRKRLRHTKKYPGIPSVKDSPTSFSLLLQPIKKKLRSLSPGYVTKPLEVIISLSGLNTELGDILLIKIICTLALGILGYFLMDQITGILPRPLFAAFLMGAGFMLPDLYLINTAKKRRKKILTALPNFLEYLNIAVEAGLGLDMAIAKVVSKQQGPLSEEFAKTLTEIRYGKSKRDAFKAMSARINLPELSSFLTALINGEQMGISLGTILTSNSQQLREKRRQQTQAAAYKIPVKLVFPLVIFILPGLFIILLGPAVIQIFNSVLR